MYKILINESMNIIMEKLDILNIFRNLCAIENNFNKCNNNNKHNFKMSEKLAIDLSEIIYI